MQFGVPVVTPAPDRAAPAAITLVCTAAVAVAAVPVQAAATGHVSVSGTAVTFEAGKEVTTGWPGSRAATGSRAGPATTT